ncbi:MAG: hypothetical protein ACTSQA_00275 [Candidatus Heimdallarchaeaceae archaeon]
MVITTQSMSNKVTEDSTPEGYEFVKDSEGRIAIKKIRDSVKKAVKETTEAVESIKDVAETIVSEVVKPLKSKKKRGKK